jgi:5-methylcytosine-specific restriction protein B
MLEPAVKQKLVEKLQQMNNDGKLLSRQQLDQFYGTFRNQFGPEKLASLDGTALLETMHGLGTKDSLVYWLEFKNDEEFPARFGGIGGGSAFKYGVFRRKETKTWVTSDESNNAKDISVEEAVAIARKHRDQLLKGVELLKQVPPNATDEEYSKLQDGLDREAPDVSHLGWGHKYFHLIFPEKLDHLHAQEFQRFHLLKLLQRPPDSKGRYVCAGRFVAAASEIGVPMNNLMEVLYSVNGSPHAYWRIGTSDGKAPRNHWPMMRDGNCVAVGWPDLKDLSDLEKNKESKEKLQQLLAEKYPTTPQAVGKARSQIFNFVLGIEEGDVVLASDGGTVLGIGRVTGPYSYDPTSDFPHRRPVQWLSLEEWKMPEPEGLQTPVHEVRKNVANILETERKARGATPSPSVPPPVKSPTSDVPGARQQWPRLQGIPGRIQTILERKGQLIVYGPPGTGKTFWAQKAALDLAAYWAFGKAFEQLTADDERVVVGGEHGNGLVRVCCFHPAYGYEDFIEGYRPETHNGQISFQLRDGVFKRLAKDAAQAPDRRYFLIVDEINRGDIPRIFGELLTVLEKDKRGKPIMLPVSGDAFRVPPNVYLIGTMNTADRSISLLDAALRRRFGFIELMPDATVLKDHVVGSIPLGPWLVALNQRICANVGRDARNLQIGHSYLLQGERPLRDFASFKRALRDDIIPLLEEYCYNDFDALHKILGTGLLDAENRRIKHELFDDGRDAELAQALISPSPDIIASPQALSSTTPVEDVAAEEEGDEGAEQ